MTGPTLTEPAPSPELAPGADSRRTRQVLILLGIVLVVALGLLVLAVAINATPFGPSDHAAHTVVGDLDGRKSASIDLASGTGTVAVRTTDLGDDLFRVSTPDGSGQLPRAVVQGDAVTVSLVDAEDRGGAAPLEMLLSSRVAWSIRISGGANRANLDLRGGPVSTVDLTSGISTVELWLPAPVGTARILETGGASLLALHAPTGVPVRLTVTGGAGSATIDGVTRSGISGNTVLGSPDWDSAPDRYDVRLIGGVSTLTLDRP